jgi:ABC-2 type transport system permease protein
VSALHAVHGIVARDLSRAFRQKSRLVGGIARPFMWLLLVGAGFNAIARFDGGVSYQEFIYPGIVAMAALFGSMLAAIATVYDREFGMLRLMLASPAGVGAVLAGRAAAATLLGTLQGGIVLLCAPLLLHITPLRFAAACGALVLVATSSSVLGLLVAVRLRSVENFAGIFNVVLFPLFFVSGALYPVSGMPPWLRGAALLNPATYQVELMRAALGMPAEIAVTSCLLALGVTIVAGFVAAGMLFDPEERFTARGWRQPRPTTRQPPPTTIHHPPSTT